VNDVALAGAQTRYALRGFLRDPRALVFTVVMPVMLLLLFNAIFHGYTQFDGLAVPSASYYTASIISYQIMLAGFGSLLVSVTTAREGGLLKRFRGTPMPSWVYLIAEIGQTVVVVVVTVAILVAVGALFYHVRLSGSVVVGLVVYAVAGTACFCALSLAVCRICTTTESATAIGPFSTVILAFLSGVFIPVAIMPSWLLDIGKVFPLEHLARGLQTAFLVPGSTGLTPTNLGVLAAWGVGGLVLAVRTFRWEPLAGGGA
jgi:ABC-2 type transport system permease protein